MKLFALSLSFVAPTLLSPASTAQLTQHAYLKASSPGALDNFGYAMAIDGDTLVVAAPLEDSNATGVDGDQADNSLAESGAVYVFLRQGNGWAQQAYLKASNSGGGDNFGWKVAVSGDTLVVGAPFEDGSSTGVNGPVNNLASGAGAVYVFRRTGSVWTQEAYMKASNAGPDDNFGYSVAIDGDTLVVGAINEDSDADKVDGTQGNDLKQDAGAAYVFVREGSTWSQQAYLKAANSDAFDSFGWAVAVEGDRAFVGAPGEASNTAGDAFDNSLVFSGAAYAFLRVGASWDQTAYLKASVPDGLQSFGKSLAVSQGTLAVTAPNEGNGASCVDGNPLAAPLVGSGAVYVFHQPSGTAWVQQAYVKASNPGSIDTFGTSVALDGDELLVGAPWEKSDATGIDGPDNDDSLQSGAAYLYRRSGSTWSCESYLKASNTDANDYFGTSVALDAGTYAVGANQESSSSKGINGGQADDGLISAGGVYTFGGPVSGCGATPYGPNTGANYGSISSSVLPVAGGNFLVQLTEFASSNPGGKALLVLSGASASSAAYGGTLLVDPLQSIVGPGLFLPVPLTAGEGEIVLPLPATAGGLKVYAQAIRFDLAQPAWLGLTNGLEIEIGS